ncbi:DUF3298 domain-containing protein [Mycolicibacterium boenickei]|uniref:DUF3298 domain-containing protein n=1 Tax=Mycolicibacterium boenickei TaxID=146017 RepID=A0ABM7J3Q5_9MYCO|nr:DUF3298 domain-containing protein [Mycolicibacterium boenickei]BBX93843.1 hypothetical protein MBOE_54920 [Mycolicibacterium boenickei]
MIRRLVSAAAIVSMIGVGAACNSPDPGSGTGPAPTTVDATTTPASPDAEAQPFTGFLETVDGTRGIVTYKAELPQLKGGAAAVRDKFNASVRAALDDYLRPTEDNLPVTVAPGTLLEDERSRVSHIGSGVVAGVLLLNIYVEHAAHPFNTVSTTVIDAHTAAPIMITDLFADQNAGLNAVVQAIKAEMAGDDKLANQTPPEPVADQLANWLPDDDGLVFYLSVAHVLGDYYPVTVSWDTIAGVLAPGVREKLTK